VKAVSGRQLCRVLEKNGWVLLRVHGSHHYFGKEGVEVKLSVPVHGNQSLKPGLLRSLLKAAGLSEDDL
jgi:predicted RNA binding protein YcfA (HicA-like mRNA interferase family)